MESYVFIPIFVLLGIAFMFANMTASWLFRSKGSLHRTTKSDVYECGEEPVGTAWVQFDVKFYITILLFELFAVETAFIIPWAMVFGSMQNVVIFVEMLIFILVLVLALMYAIKTEAMEWV